MMREFSRRTRRAEAMAQHPSMQARLVWTPADAAEMLADFERHADQAVALTRPRPSRGVVVDLQTRRVIS